MNTPDFLKDKTQETKGTSIIFVGAPQTGKTTKIKELLRQVNPKTILAVDFNNEYNGVGFQTTEYDELVAIGMQTKNQTLIFEEATSYFGTNNKMNVKRLLSRTKGHLGHNVFLSFHYLAGIPADILPFIDYIYITKTNEKLNNIPPPLNQLRATDSYNFTPINELFGR